MITQHPETNHRKIGTHAIVIGGSMAGLLAARILTDHFEKVTLVERDRLPERPENRKGVPQGQHAHALLAKGLEVLSQLFPDLVPALVESGAVMVDLSGDFRWHHRGDCNPQYQSGLVGPFMSRPLLESLIRRRVLGLQNLECIQECDTKGLIASDDRTRITGVKIHRRMEGATEEQLTADLIVDATGRGSQSPRWLEALGYARPEETVIKIGVGYTTRIYRRTSTDLQGAKAVFVSPTPPHERRGGTLFPLEGDRWLVTLYGLVGDHAPAEEQGFLEFARSLPAPDIYNVVARAEPLTDFVVHKLPSNLRRRYEKLARFPDGYLVFGDALCSFNPTYGQGMTVSALEAQVLDVCLREQWQTQRDWHGFPQRFFRQVAKVVDIPWSLAAGADFSYPGVEGQKAPGTDQINWYVEKILRAMISDPKVHLAFLRVMNLIDPLPALFAPRIVLRVLRANLTVRGKRISHVRNVPLSQATPGGISPASDINPT